MLLYRLALGLVRLWLFLRRATAGLPGHGAERLSPPAARSDRPVWLHGASNGELTAARMAVAGLAGRGQALLVTTNSETARSMVQGWNLPGVEVRLAPLDATAVVRRFLDAAGPAALVIVENELWPNRLTLAAARGLPVLVLGARLSAKSARLWARLPRLARRLLGTVAWLAPQDEDSRARFLALGLPPDRLGPTLSLKSTVGPADAPRPDLPWPRALTLLAASTHEGEEDAVLDAFVAARAAHPGLRLILAPRHPRRRDAIEALIALRELAFATRSRGAAPDAATPVYLADTMGEMALWYQAAGLTFVGGSLTDRGGHTPFEPAAFGSAILHGPHLSNFAAAYAALAAAGAAVEAPDGAALAQALARLAGDADAQTRLAAAARPALAGLAPPDGLEAFFTALCSLTGQSRRDSG